VGALRVHVSVQAQISDKYDFYCKVTGGNLKVTCFGDFNSPSSDLSISHVQRKLHRCPFLQTHNNIRIGEGKK
jgi:hypothetical protein